MITVRVMEQPGNTRSALRWATSGRFPRVTTGVVQEVWVTRKSIIQENVEFSGGTSRGRRGWRSRSC